MEPSFEHRGASARREEGSIEGAAQKERWDNEGDLRRPTPLFLMKRIGCAQQSESDRLTSLG